MGVLWPAGDDERPSCAAGSGPDLKGLLQARPGMEAVAPPPFPTGMPPDQHGKARARTAKLAHAIAGSGGEGGVMWPCASWQHDPLHACYCMQHAIKACSGPNPLFLRPVAPVVAHGSLSRCCCCCCGCLAAGVLRVNPCVQAVGAWVLSRLRELPFMDSALPCACHVECSPSPHPPFTHSL